MDIDPNDLVIFARIADAGSFSRAAERTGLPKSTVSRRMARIEARLGERLLQRTTRKLVLTEFGASLLEHAREVIVHVESAGALAQHRQAQPSGRLRISMPGDFAHFALGNLLPEFMTRYPQVSLELDLSPRRVDLVGENFDLAIRMGELPDDASLAARRIASMTVGLYASAAYVARRGLPDHPDALVGHDLLCLSGRAGGAPVWTLTRGATRWERMLPARALANSPELLIRLARAGSGIAAVADPFALPCVQCAELVRILPEWSLPPVTGWAVFPGRRLMPAKTRAFLDLLAGTLGETAVVARPSSSGRPESARGGSRKTANATTGAAFCSRQYDNRARVPEHPQFIERWQRESRGARARLRCALDLRFGDAPRETLDFFPARDVDGPCMMFIHGGYWRALDKRDFSFLAPAWVEEGVSVAIIGYELCPAVAIEDIVRQVLHAGRWLWLHARELGVDRDRLYVCGHSAGAHLAAMLMAARWPALDAHLPADLFKGALAISGIYDLRPLVHVDWLAHDLRLDAAAALRVSPAFLPPATRAPLMTCVGGAESEEFRRQNALLGKRWRSVLAADLPMPGAHHFSVLDGLCTPSSALFAGARRLMTRGR